MLSAKLLGQTCTYSLGGETFMLRPSAAAR